MYKFRLLFAYLFFFTLASAQSDYSIVFVHLGSSIPSYLYDSAKQAHLFNPATPIYVIANKDALNNKHTLPYVTFIERESLKQSKAHRDFRKHSTLNTAFRDGFWRKATERFFYLDEFIQTYQLTNVFHLEYDNMLYVDLHELMDAFKHYKGIAAIFDTQNRCVPNFMFIPHPAYSQHLVTFIAQHAQKGLNDMHMIGLYNNSYDNSYIASLPIIPKEYRSFQKKVADPSFFYGTIAQFNSVFDGAALGQYLGGIDPRNGPSSPGFVNRDCVFDASHFSYEWIQDNQGRKIPYLKYRGKKYRINNLHIHSKKLQTFRSK